MSGISIIRRLLSRLLVLTVVLVVVSVIYLSHAFGADIVQRSLTLSDNRPGMTASYLLGFTVPAPETLGSIKLLFCANSAIMNDVCTPPTGLDISTAVLSAQTGETGFSILGSGTDANTLILTRTPAAAGAVPVSYTFDGVTNPSSTGEFFARLQTFATDDATGPENEGNGMALSINEALPISTVVPPYLLFCSGVVITGFDCSTASGDYINLGDQTSTTTGSAQSQLVTASNAANGFAIWNYGTTMTSGNNIIDAMASRDVSRPGISQFGLNLVRNATPGVGEDPQGPGGLVPTANYSLADWFQFVSGDMIASVNQADDLKKLTVSYIINIAKDQAPGVYATTLTYVCLANF